MNQRAPWTEEIRIDVPNVLPPPPGAGKGNAGPSLSAGRRPEGFLKISLLILFLLAAGCAQKPITKSDGDFQFPLTSYRIRQSFANPNPLFRGLYHSAEDGGGGNYPDWKPHLHFGLRQGKRADYPDFGDSRWMAGYTSAHPTRLGWLEPKKFIESH